MNNKEIRILIFENNIKKYEVANKLGITPYTFSHWLQVELPQSKKAEVLNAIQELIK